MPGTFRFLRTHSVYTHPPWIPKTVSLILSFLLVPIATPSSTEMFLQDLQESFQNKMLILQLLHTQLLISDSQSEPSVACGRHFGWSPTVLTIIRDETCNICSGLFGFSSHNNNQLVYFFCSLLNCPISRRRWWGLEFEMSLLFYLHFSICTCTDMQIGLCPLAGGSGATF